MFFSLHRLSNLFTQYQDNLIAERKRFRKKQLIYLCIYYNLWFAQHTVFNNLHQSEFIV